MGQAKYNQTAILAKEGKLPPKKPQRKMSQAEFCEALLKAPLFQFQRDILDQLDRSYTRDIRMACNLRL